MKKKFDRDVLHEALVHYMKTSGDVRPRAWDRACVAAGLPVHGTLTKYIGDGRGPLQLFTDYATQYAPNDRTLLWSLCPDGVLHGGDSRGWTGTVIERAASRCEVCREQARRAEERVLARAAWEASLPPLGGLMPRPGGGQAIALDRALGDALVVRGLEVRSDLGVRIPLDRDYPWSYHPFIGQSADDPWRPWPLPALKPDLVLPDLRVAIELDNTSGSSDRWRGFTNRHHTSDGVADDQARDAVLGEFGWRVLRVRRPDAPTVGDWPWRVETTSQSARILAQLIIEALSINPAP